MGLIGHGILEEKRMKLCFLANANSSHTIRWVRWFVNKKHEVTVITMTPPDKPIKGCNIIRLKRGRRLKPITFWFRIREIKKYLKRLKPDLIHAHYITTYGFMAALTGFHPVMISAWGSDVLINPKQSKRMKYRAMKAIEHADMCHCDGIKTRQALKELGASEDKIATVYFGVDCEKYKPRSEYK